jgi:hypothetical protein
LESNLIYAASDSLKHKVNWVKVSSETEWSYFGAEADANKPHAIKFINEYFPDTILLIAISRNDSFQIKKNEIEEAIDKILGLKDFHIWNISFIFVLFIWIGLKKLT